MAGHAAREPIKVSEHGSVNQRSKLTQQGAKGTQSNTQKKTTSEKNRCWQRAEKYAKRTQQSCKKTCNRNCQITAVAEQRYRPCRAATVRIASTLHRSANLVHQLHLQALRSLPVNDSNN